MEQKELIEFVTINPLYLVALTFWGLAPIAAGPIVADLYAKQQEANKVACGVREVKF